MSICRLLEAAATPPRPYPPLLRLRPWRRAGQHPDAGALTAATVVPKRISGSLGLSLEDIAAIGSANSNLPCGENLSLVLSAELDNQLLNGAGSSNDLNGIIVA